MALRPSIEGHLHHVSELVRELWPALSSTAPPTRSARVLAALIAANADLQAELESFVARIKLHGQYTRLRAEADANAAHLARFVSRSQALESEIHDLLRQRPIAPPVSTAPQTTYMSSSSSSPDSATSTASAANAGRDAARLAKRARRAAAIAAQPGSLSALYRTAASVGYEPYDTPLRETGGIGAAAMAAAAADADADAEAEANSEASADGFCAHPSSTAAFAAAGNARPPAVAPGAPVKVKDLLLLAEAQAVRAYPAIRPPRVRKPPVPADTDEQDAQGTQKQKQEQGLGQEQEQEPGAPWAVPQHGPWPMAPILPRGPDVGSLVHAKQNAATWPLDRLVAMLRESEARGSVEFALEPGWRTAQELRRAAWENAHGQHVRTV